MGVNYTSLQNTANKLINDNGSTITIKKITNGVPDMSTDTVVNSETLVNTVAIKKDFTNREIDSDLIQLNDLKVILKADTDITKNDELIIDGVTYEIINIKVSKPADIVLNYIVQVRK